MIRRTPHRHASPTALLCALALAGCQLLGPDVPSTDPATVRLVTRLPATGDPAELTAAAVDGDTLALGVAYSGGCNEHDWTLYATRSFTLSTPPRTRLTLVHEDHDDACDAYLQDALRFDLRPALRAWRRDVNGPIELELVVAGSPAEPLRVPATL